MNESAETSEPTAPAYYRRWECNCEKYGDSPVAVVEPGERPADLLAAYPWPSRDLRCDCGGTLNLMDPEDRPDFYALAPEMLKGLERVADAERVLLRLLDRKLPGWRQGYCFDEMFGEVRALVARARGRV